MNRAFFIDQPDDLRLEPFRNLRERDLARRDGLFVGEGELTVARMLGIPTATRTVLTTESRANRLLEIAGEEVEVLVASEELIAQIAGFPFHRGVLAVGHRSLFEDRVLDDLLPRVGEPATILLIDGVTNVDNIGLLFRNAAAFACDGVVLSSSCHDPLYRKALRVSLGHVLSLPYVRVDDWREALVSLRTRGICICAAALGPDAVALDDFEVPDRVALVVGQEFSGVSAASLAGADRVLRIPMAPRIDSLNVAAASAVCLHRLSRGTRE